ncbi:hypothetical protein SNEBB_004909 [Seison nebaliae]|nr:hypothetical protein SNEBB_004909 [Seison nebaliae]
MSRRPVSVKDVEPTLFLDAFAQLLKDRRDTYANDHPKEESLEPKWICYVKTGTNKELAPMDPDWFWKRVAAVARHVYLRNPASTRDMQKIFGGKKNFGNSPSHFQLASGNICRKSLIILEKLKMVKKIKKGRVLSKYGRRDMDNVANAVFCKVKESG